MANDSSAPHAVKPYLLMDGEGAAGFRTAGHLTMIESHTQGGAPWHVHSREDEYFYVLEGAIVVHCGEEEYRAGPRSFVFLPRGIPHAWDVDGESATLLMMTVPAMLEELLREFHAASTRKERDQIASGYEIQFLWDKK
ncbi:MAG TPA: cupin domain-containing protein [Pyrinomonadaceae bacterium]|nr:cupin domain-containing protein [Pyrinomonadaceae bacterium]